MKIGITHRLFLAILAAALLAVICMFFIMQWSLGRGFLRFVTGLEEARLSRLAQMLEADYDERGNWNFLHSQPDNWRRLVAVSLPGEELMRRQPDAPPGREFPPPPGGEPPGQGLPLHLGEGPSQPPPPHLLRGFAERVFLLDGHMKPLAGTAVDPGTARLRPLLHRGVTVGYVGLMPLTGLTDEIQLRIMKEQKLALALVAVMLVLLAAGLSLPLAHRLVRPIRSLAAATGRLAAGEFKVRVPENSTDELGRLAHDFNALAVTLEKNELSRRQWVADISHELRTPLAILRGEIEALQDGVRPLDDAAVNSLHGEVLRLGRLVDDLYQLSLSDLGALTYRKEAVDFTEPLMAALAHFRPEFGGKCIALTVENLPGTSMTVWADAARLRQLFANLLDNAAKYTDPGGRVVIRAGRGNGDMVMVEIEDSSPGVRDCDLARLFDRLYRVEASRSRAAGGAGLGLAICRNIVEAHDGRITVRHSTLGGIAVRVDIPLSEEH